MDPRKKHRRAGFFVVFGWRTIAVSDGAQPVDCTCPGCKKTSRMVGKVHQKWFTLFFLPVFPLESRQGAYRFTRCSLCKRDFDIVVEQLARKINASGQMDYQSAITLFNELRDHPADSSRLLQLIKIYQSLGDRREAESACKAFPQAFAADPTCEQELAKIA